MKTHAQMRLCQRVLMKSVRKHIIQQIVYPSYRRCYRFSVGIPQPYISLAVTRPILLNNLLCKKIKHINTDYLMQIPYAESRRIDKEVFVFLHLGASVIEFARY